jgi:alcohol dehydrogenase class IV
MSNIMLELRKFVAPELVFGIDARLMAGRYAANLGVKRSLLVTDANVIAAGWAGDVEQSLIEAGIEVRRFTGVSPNPRDSEVMSGAAFYAEHGCDALVAVGGGSIIDCAKGIGIVISNGKGILDYEGIDRVAVPMPPLICIPTTGGTSADLSQFAIITNSAEQVKIAVISKAIVPDVALVDPVTLTSMDAYLTACTGMDALSHAIEAYVSNASSPITDLHALEAMRLVAASLRRSVEAPHDMEERGQMMLASLQAGLAFSNASLGAVHSMAHSLGGYKDLPHGECNALLLPHVIDYNFQRVPERFRRIAAALGIPVTGLSDTDVRNTLIRGVIELRRQCGIDGTLAGRGVTIGDVGMLAGKAIKDPCNATNPRIPTKVDLDTVYREAL